MDGERRIGALHPGEGQELVAEPLGSPRLAGVGAGRVGPPWPITLPSHRPARAGSVRNVGKCGEYVFAGHKEFRAAMNNGWSAGHIIDIWCQLLERRA